MRYKYTSSGSFAVSKTLYVQRASGLLSSAVGVANVIRQMLCRRVFSLLLTLCFQASTLLQRVCSLFSHREI
jgi:hypothetical protein